MRIIRDRSLTYDAIRENLENLFPDPDRATDRLYGIVSGLLPGASYYDIWYGEIVITGKSNLRRDDVLEILEIAINRLFEKM